MSKRSTTTRPRDPAEITALAIERRMTRRGFLVGSGMGLGAIALAGCAPPAASAPPSAAAPSARRQRALPQARRRRPRWVTR